MGSQGVQARLRGEGINIQRQGVRDANLRVDPAGVAQRALGSQLERRLLCAICQFCVAFGWESQAHQVFCHFQVLWSAK